MKFVKRKSAAFGMLLAVALLFTSCGLFSDESFEQPPPQEPIVLNPANRGEDTGRVIIDGNVNSGYSIEEGEAYVIGERFFVEQCNEVYYNFTDYLGKTIQYEGLFMPEFDPLFDETIYYVYRYGPGCCGIDANVGFEVNWSGEYPAPESWVRATGVLVHYEQEGFYFVRLELSEIEVLETRGEEVVAVNPEYSGNAHQG